MNKQEAERIGWKHDGDYKVIRNEAEHWWDIPYEIYSPTGQHITATATLWGARREIRKHRRRNWVEVWREPESGLRHPRAVTAITTP